MEILKLDIVGTYSYKPDMNIVSYDSNDFQHTKECIICKRGLMEPSYEMLSDNKNISTDNDILIGKCGHMFHGDCLCKWLEKSECCPIDNVKWCFHRVVDTTTKLVMYDSLNAKRKSISTSASTSASTSTSTSNSASKLDKRLKKK